MSTALERRSTPPLAKRGTSLCFFPIPPPYPGHCARMASLSSLHENHEKNTHEEQRHNSSSGYASTISSSSEESEHECLSDAGFVGWYPRSPIKTEYQGLLMPARRNTVVVDGPMSWSLSPREEIICSPVLPEASITSATAGTPLLSPMTVSLYSNNSNGVHISPVPVTLRQSRATTRAVESDKEWRRRSVPAYMRDTFSVDVMNVLEQDGHIRCETDVDTGERRTRLDSCTIKRQESVLELARRFAEINAAQELERHKKRSLQLPRAPFRHGSARSVGGIVSLSLSRGELRRTSSPAVTMSRVNIFKQMDAQNRPAVPVMAPRSPNSIKDALLRWVQSRVHDYPVEITNFSSSWSDGMAFCALIHRFAPDAFDFSELRRDQRAANFDLAFRVAEERGIPALLETEDMIAMGDRPDWKCVFTYVQQFYKKFREAP